MNTTFEIGDFISDGYGNTGIVHEKIPEIVHANSFKGNLDHLNEWLDVQTDKRLKLQTGQPWLGVIATQGGSFYAPESLCTKIRKATNIDFEDAMKKANHFAQEDLKKALNTN